jgi:uncharacterized membrane protein SirB2
MKSEHFFFSAIGLVVLALFVPDKTTAKWLIVGAIVLGLTSKGMNMADISDQDKPIKGFVYAAALLAIVLAIIFIGSIASS